MAQNSEDLVNMSMMNVWYWLTSYCERLAGSPSSDDQELLIRIRDVKSRKGFAGFLLDIMLQESACPQFLRQAHLRKPLMNAMGTVRKDLATRFHQVTSGGASPAASPISIPIPVSASGNPVHDVASRGSHPDASHDGGQSVCGPGMAHSGHTAAVCPV